MLKKNFAHKELKKPPQKVAYLWQLGVFFLCNPDCPKQPKTAQNSPELHFCFMISFIQSSPLRSLALIYPCCRKRGNILVIGHCCCYPSKSRVLVRILNLLVLFAIFIFNFQNGTIIYEFDIVKNSSSVKTKMIPLFCLTYSTLSSASE